jgi:tetratricopeptide (TPR) repeat protein
MRLAWLMAVFFAAAPAALETARDRQDRPALETLAEQYAAAAAKSPNDAAAQYHAALASSYLAQVAIELHDRKGARPVAERGIKAAEKAVALKPAAEHYCVLATLYGQAITDIMSGLSYAPKAKAAVGKAVEIAPNASFVYVARGVGNYYMPAQLGGGPKAAIPDFQRAIQLEPKNAEAYLWLGIALRQNKQDAEARQAFARSLEINPKRVWTRQQLEKTPAK